MSDLPSPAPAPSAPPPGLVRHALQKLWQVRFMLLAGGLVLALTQGIAGIDPLSALAGIALMLAGAFLTSLPTDPSTNTARRQARSRIALATLDARAGALIAALPGACIVIDRRGIVVLHNAVALENNRDLRVGAAFVLAIRAPNVVEAVEATLAGGAGCDVPFEEKTPVERWFRAYVAPIHLVAAKPGAAPDYVAVSVQDLTGQMRLERMRVDFVANASHELRTPLASLTGFIETLQGPARNDPEAREKFLTIMHRQAWRMSRLIDDLLSLSRIEMHAHVRPRTVLDLRHIAAQTVDALAPVAAEARTRVRVIAPDTPLMMRAERDELVRVAENLIENAIKYGHEGGEVIVSLGQTAAGKADRGTIFLKVQDNGPGIAAEHLPRLTERFYRVDVSSSRERGGTGLGLALVKHIINRHRGRLEIESTPGKGSSFTARFEAAAPEA